VDGVDALVEELTGAWGSWGPNMTPHADRVAFISDRLGTPRLWVQDVVLDGPPPEPTPIVLSADPVVAVRWSADASWLACSVAADGGVRTQVWVVRPDGTEARLVGGAGTEHAVLGPWTRSGHRLVVTVPSNTAGEPAHAYLVSPATGAREHLAEGELINVMDLSVEERLVVLRDGRRGEEFCVVLDRVGDRDHPLMPHSGTGATDVALLRPAPAHDPAPMAAYLVTEVGLPRRQLVRMPLGPDGWRGRATVLAARDDAELEELDADDAGHLLLLLWNVAGRSELELLDTRTGDRSVIAGMPGLVASSAVLSRTGESVLVSVEGPERPRELWHVDTPSHRWTRVTQAPEPIRHPLVVPTLETFRAADGLELSGWLYQAPDRSSGAAVLYLHGGPEGQERPQFDPQHQALAAAGLTVFAPNIRGSSGYGRAFGHADNRHGRFDAFRDVAAAAHFLVGSGLADPARLGVSGRSYGGYLTLAALAFSPGLFAAGVDVCGMSDLTTFYRDTEPWIAAAAVSKYGDPVADLPLLEQVSPMRQVDAITAPLLVVHGELDTNVPIGEAHQIVRALRERGREVDYLELPGEGHVYRRRENVRTLISRTVRFLTAHVGSAARGSAASVSAASGSAASGSAALPLGSPCAPTSDGGA
jgi:dipeptidyl aminopeptidase/acylaminoacyl peptidase